MKIVNLKSLEIPEIKVIRLERYHDARGYFSEIYKKSVLQKLPGLNFLKDVEFVQCNESYSRARTVRGLHFQWEPPQSKLVRVVSGKIVDLTLDIRKGSPTLGKIIAYELASTPAMQYSEWLWVPAGFAHGFFAVEESLVEYFCTAEWNPKGEAGISPMACDLDWSLCDPHLKKLFEQTLASSPLLSNKDRQGYTLSSWLKEPHSNQFNYKEL